MDVFSLHDEITQWQAEHDLRRLPTVEEHRELCNRITAYLEKGKTARVRAMKKAYEPDVDFVKVLKLDCLEMSDDMIEGVKWRSDLEKELMHSLPGWSEGFAARASFVPLSDVIFAEEENLEACKLKEVFAVLQDMNKTPAVKLTVAARMLDCTPTMCGVMEALARRVYHHHEDEVEVSLERYVCRLCNFTAAEHAAFVEHLEEKHRGCGDTARVVIEYRKKVIGILEHLGPTAAWLMDLDETDV